MVTGMPASDHSHARTDAIDRSRIAYTVEETAHLLSLSVRKVKYLVNTGELASIKVGRARRVHGSAIEEFAQQQTAPGAKQAS